MEEIASGVPLDSYSDTATDEQIYMLTTKLKREREKRYAMQDMLEHLEQEKQDLFENISSEITGIISEMATKKHSGKD